MKLIAFFRDELGSSKPWLKLTMLLLAFIVGSLIVYAIQHLRMNNLREYINETEKTHIREISKLQERHIKQISELERSLKSSTVIIEKTLPDGTITKETREDVDLTENITVKTEVVERIVEVIKEVIVEKEIIKEVEITSNCPIIKPYSFGVNAQPTFKDTSIGVGSIGVDATYKLWFLEARPFTNYHFDRDNSFEFGVMFGIRF